MLTPDFKEFAALLNSNKVEYLVVGGYALAAYGHPRYTGDLDFWIGPIRLRRPRRQQSRPDDNQQCDSDGVSPGAH